MSDLVGYPEDQFSCNEAHIEYEQHKENTLLFCICENEGEDELCGNDQLCGNSTADQCLCLRYIDSTIHLLPFPKFPVSIHLLWLVAWFVSDLVGNLKDRLSHEAAHMILQIPHHCLFY